MIALGLVEKRLKDKEIEQWVKFVSRENQEGFYKQVIEELKLGQYDLDIWQMALDQSGNDENIALAKYKLLRVKRLAGKEETEETPSNIANQELEAELQDVKPPIHLQKELKPFFKTTMIYFCIIFSLSYVSWTLSTNQKVISKQHQKIRETVIGNQYQLTNEWNKLRESKSFRRLPDKEKNTLEEKYNLKLIRAREDVMNMETPAEAKQKLFAELGMTSLIILVGIANLIVILMFSGHLRLGCFTTFFLLAIPVIGWAAIVYLGIRNCGDGKANV